MKMDHLSQFICDMDVSIDLKLDLNFVFFFPRLDRKPRNDVHTASFEFQFRIHPQCCGIYMFIFQKTLVNISKY